MKNTVAPKQLDEPAVLIGLGELPSHVSTIQDTPVHQVGKLLAPTRTARSYQPYSWGLVNSTLDIVDDKTHGRAGQLQRFVSYLFFGGTAAIVNLIVFSVMLKLVPIPVSELAHNTIAYIVAAELSIMANFIPNDHFTFKHLPGAHHRPWIIRCLRFHMTAISGTILTFLIELALTFFMHTHPVIAEAIAIIIVLFYNFSVHHLFTYRRVKHAY